MFNFKFYCSSSTAFLKDVIESKNKKPKEQPPLYKDRILKFNSQLAMPYTNYDSSFNIKSFYTIISDPKFHISDVKSDLMELYSYRASPFVKLKNTLVELPNNRSFDTCQYCAINSINTFDHILPKDQFPEFSVHPKNLFPACSQCNSKKSKKLLKNGIPEFLNLYIDILPKEQFLFANVTYINNTFSTKFELKNVNSIDQKLFKIIENHFKNLDLLKRYEKQANTIISSFEIMIFSNIKNNTLDGLLQISINSFDGLKKSLGYNYYKTILEEELCHGAAFRTYCKLRGVT